MPHTLKLYKVIPLAGPAFFQAKPHPIGDTSVKIGELPGWKMETVEIPWTLPGVIALANTAITEATVAALAGPAPESVQVHPIEGLRVQGNTNTLPQTEPEVKSVDTTVASAAATGDAVAAALVIAQANEQPATGGKKRRRSGK
jgi:hypothetical protein